MEKTINCAECGESVTYNEREGYPRKYCDVHSAERKAQWLAKQAEFKHASESKPTHAPIDKDSGQVIKDFGDETSNIPIEKIGNLPADEQIGLEFEIRSRQCRVDALKCALEYSKIYRADEMSSHNMTALARTFEEYILGEE